MGGDIFSKTFALSLFAKKEALMTVIPVSSVVLIVTHRSPEECLRDSNNEGSWRLKTFHCQTKDQNNAGDAIHTQPTRTFAPH